MRRGKSSSPAVPAEKCAKIQLDGEKRKEHPHGAQYVAPDAAARHGAQTAAERGEIG